MFLNNPGHRKITLVLSASTVLLFLGLGYLFVFTDAYSVEVPFPRRRYVGYMLWAWAVFRGITVWMKFRNLRKEEEHEND